MKPCLPGLRPRPPRQTEINDIESSGASDSRSSAWAGEFVASIRTVTVVGLGKIGLPLSVQLASKGLVVIGADVNEQTVSLIQAGQPPFPGEPELAERLQEQLASGRFSAQLSTREAVAVSDAVIVVVPLVVTDPVEGPRWHLIDAATAEVGAALRPGTLVSYETTLPVGTTRDRFGPALEAASGLRAGVDFDLCFSPERVSSGSVFRDLRKYPKVVGGINQRSTERAVELYTAGLDFDDRGDLPKPNGVWEVSSAEAAELVKLAETTYRDINIAFANELAIFADRRQLDVGAVIEAANSQPYSHIHQPGVAVGGHCIPVYPHLYLMGHADAEMPRTARRVNGLMPKYAVDELKALLGGSLVGQRVAVLGLAFRGGVKETALSGAWPLVASLTAVGAIVVVEDPLYSDSEIQSFGLEPHHLGEPVDAAIIQADHAEYRQLSPKHLPGIRGLVDGRNILTDPAVWAEAGVRVTKLGRTF
jgi:UDP-N-acetyl-D-glucosamine dehydrogenase